MCQGGLWHPNFPSPPAPGGGRPPRSPPAGWAQHPKPAKGGARLPPRASGWPPSLLCAHVRAASPSWWDLVQDGVDPMCTLTPPRTPVPKGLAPMGTFPVGPGDDAGAMRGLGEDRAECELEERNTHGGSFHGNDRGNQTFCVGLPWFLGCRCIQLLAEDGGAKPPADASLRGSSLQPTCLRMQNRRLTRRRVRPALRSSLSIKCCAKTEGCVVKLHRAGRNVVNQAVNNRFINWTVHTRWHTTPCLLLLCYTVFIRLALRQHPNLVGILPMQAGPHPIAVGWVRRRSTHPQNWSSPWQNLIYPHPWCHPGWLNLTRGGSLFSSRFVLEVQSVAAQAAALRARRYQDLSTSW